jgi:hypothetical protein
MMTRGLALIAIPVGSGPHGRPANGEVSGRTICLSQQGVNTRRDLGVGASPCSNQVTQLPLGKLKLNFLPTKKPAKLKEPLICAGRTGSLCRFSSALAPLISRRRPGENRRCAMRAPAILQ